MPTFLWPLKKSSQRRTQCYGDIWSADSAKKHTGIDLAAAPGDSVFAVATGIITRIGLLDDKGKWAKYAVLEHDAKDYCTSYLHITPKVTIGQKLKSGELVGVVADIVGPHFHFNVWKGPKNEKLTQRGALPIVFAGGDPIFPNDFLNPDSFTYIFTDGSTAVPTPPPNAPLFTRDLSKDCTGPDVKLLQRMLNTDPNTTITSIGLGSPGEETESFGILTEKALQRFQIKHKLAVAGDAGFGIVGPKTRAKLQELFGNKKW